MAICMIFTPPKDLYDHSTYEKVIAHMGEDFPPATMRVHLNGHGEDGNFRIIDVFESAEAFEAFAASHAPIYEEMGLSLDDIMPYVQIFEVEKSIIQ